MDIQKFWSMIEEFQQESNGIFEVQHELLITALSLLSVQEIQEFGRIFWRLKRESLRADLWEAVSVIACGCGDDAFDSFQNWLIVQGKTVFEKVLNDPENLADIVPKAQRFNLYDIDMNMIAVDAYQRKTNQRIPNYGYGEKPIRIGGALIPERERPAKFPRIVAKIGECGEEELSS